MQIGPRTKEHHARGGGGWERDGYAEWRRVINGTEYTFQLTWHPDNRAPDYKEGMEHFSYANLSVWKTKREEYLADAGATNQYGGPPLILISKEETVHSLRLFEGLGHGSIYPDQPINVKRIPRRWLMGTKIEEWD
jgi:hypothetical protein